MGSWACERGAEASARAKKADSVALVRKFVDVSPVEEAWQVEGWITIGC